MSWQTESEEAVIKMGGIRISDVSKNLSNAEVKISINQTDDSLVKDGQNIQEEIESIQFDRVRDFMPQPLPSEDVDLEKSQIKKQIPGQ